MASVKALVIHSLQTPDGEATVWQRPSDGYINVTQICQASNKLFADWARLHSSEQYLQAVSERIGVSIDLLIDPSRTMRGPRNERGTWAHPIVAIRIAQWCSPKIQAYIDSSCSLSSINEMFTYIFQSIESINNVKSPNSRGNSLYILRQKGTNKVKIGVSSNMKRRVSYLRSSSGFLIEEIVSVRMEDAYKKELDLHSRYANKRLHGEWFAMSDSDIESLVTELSLIKKELEQ